jgi:hypothetical protein
LHSAMFMSESHCRALVKGPRLSPFCLVPSAISTAQLKRGEAHVCCQGSKSFIELCDALDHFLPTGSCGSHRVQADRPVRKKVHSGSLGLRRREGCMTDENSVPHLVG